jgi:hypothetical protein
MAEIEHLREPVTGPPDPEYWRQVDAFELLPRLIDAAPAIRAGAVFRDLTRAAGER